MARQAADKLQAKHRVCLTAYALSGDVPELVSLIKLIGINEIPKDLVDKASKRTAHGSWELREDVQTFLNEFFLQRKESSVDKCNGLENVKASKTTNIYVDLNTAEREAYSQTENDVCNSKKDRIALLRNACYRAEHGGGKIQKTMELIQEIFQDNPTEKIIIFYTSPHGAKPLISRLKDSGWKFACTMSLKTTRQRRAKVEKFRTDQDCKILLSCHGYLEGHNITDASRVIFLDPLPFPDLEDGAVGRAARIGQRNIVLVYRVIAKKTFEEKVVEVQDQRRKESRNGVLFPSNLTPEEKHLIATGEPLLHRRGLRSSTKLRRR